MLEDWFTAEFGRHEVRYHGFHNGYDSETDAWVRQQLEAMEQAISKAGRAKYGHEHDIRAEIDRLVGF